MSASERVSVELRLEDAAKFYAEAKLAAKGIEDIGKKADKSSKESKKFGKDLDLVGKSIKLIKPAALVAGIGLLTQVLAAGAAGAVGYVSALAPVVGLIGALPAGALIAAQGLAVMKLAFKGVGGAVGGLTGQLNKTKLAALTPEAQRFARSLQAAKKPILDLQKAVQKSIFPGFTRGIRSATPALTALRGPLAGTGREIGNLAARLGKLVGSGGFLADLRSQARFNNVQIGRLGGAGLHLVNVFRNLAVAARPLVSWLVRLVAGWAKNTDEATTFGRASGGLARGFHTIQVAASRVFRIIGNLAGAFFNIGRSGKKNLGDSLLVSLVKGSDALRKWTASSEGIRKMAGYFGQAKPVVYAIGRLIGAVAAEFFKFGSGGKGVAGLVDKLTSLVPILGSVVRSTTAAFGPPMIAFIKAMVQAFNPLIGSSGPVLLFLKTLTAFAKGIAWITRTVPGAAQAMTLFVGAIAVVKTVGLASAASSLFGFSKGMAAVKSAAVGARAAVVALNGGLVRNAAILVFMTAKAKLAAAASKVMAVATGALNLVMEGNPIALVVIGLAALAVGLVYAYRHSTRFRHAVQDVFGFLKSHWPLLLGILTGPIGLAVLFIVRNWDRIKRAASSVYSSVRGSLGRMVGFVASLPGKIAGAARSMFDGIKTAAVSVYRWVADKLGQIVNLARSIPGKIAGAVTSLPGKALGAVGGLFGGKAAGGLVNRTGPYLVGEKGPELVTLRTGQHVIPNHRLRMAPPAMIAPSVRMRAPQVTAPGARTQTTDGGGGVRPVTVHSHLTATLTLPDGTVIADLVDHVVGQSEARA